MRLEFVIAAGTGRAPAGIGEADSVLAPGGRGDLQFAADRLDFQPALALHRRYDRTRHQRFFKNPRPVVGRPAPPPRHPVDDLGAPDRDRRRKEGTVGVPLISKLLCRG